MSSCLHLKSPQKNIFSWKFQNYKNKIIILKDLRKNVYNNLKMNIRLSTVFYNKI